MLSGVFLVGLVGLVADRTILRPHGGPKPASAESSVPASKAPARSGRVPTDGNSPARVPLAERLDKLLPDRGDSSVKLRDPFSLPVLWSEGGAANKEKALDPIGIFTRKHQLRAVVVQGQEVCAQIDDSVLVPGQALDGFKLVSVSDCSVTFEREGKQVILELAVK